MSRLLHGDCLDWMDYIPSGSVDMILTDLPYGTTKAAWDKIIPFEPLWENYNRIIKPNGAIVLFAQSPFDKLLAASNISDFRYEWIWEKSSPTGHYNAKRMPLKAHENVLIFYKKLPTYNPQKTYGHPRKVSTASHKRNSKKSELYNDSDFTGYDSTERFPRSVLRYPSDKQISSLFSVQKPLSLIKYFINTYTKEGETVVDSCAGSGTVAEACIDLNREYICIEKDFDIFNIAKKRIDDRLRCA